MNRVIKPGDLQVDEAALTELCQRYSVRELAVFGSAARDRMHAASDVDLLVEFEPGPKVDLVDHAGLMLDLSQLMGRNVDLVSKRALKPLVRESILKEARPIYAA